MPAGDGFKIAFIGSHGTGKTTLCYGLAARLKARDLGCDVVHEVARRCPLPINGDTTTAAQAWILHNQIADELVAESRNHVVVCDRSVLDNYVYLLLAQGRHAPLDHLVADWIRSYDLLIAVPITSEPQPDGIRSTDPGFQRAVEERLREETRAFGLQPLQLDPARRSDWLDHVEEAALQSLQPAQLTLL